MTEGHERIDTTLSKIGDYAIEVQIQFTYLRDVLYDLENDSFDPQKMVLNEHILLIENLLNLFEKFNKLTKKQVK
jgi:hypothetical protein